MKVKTLVKKAQEELKTEQEKEAVAKVKQSLKTINDMKRTLKQIQEKHEGLLQLDVDEVEDYEW